MRAEWTKFRTVRGWVIGMIVAVVLVDVIGLLAVQSSIGCPNGKTGAACLHPLPTGPGGEAVNDSFYFVHRPLAGNGTITARVTSLTGELPSGSGGGIAIGPGGTPVGQAMHPGLEPWSKAGIIIKASTRQGSAYAAVLVADGHGTRMQYNYTQDIAGPPGRPSAATPRWLRLTRSGDTITGYASADGTHWTQIGTATLAGLPATVQAGLFATSPAYSQTRSQGLAASSNTGGPTTATGWPSPPPRARTSSRGSSRPSPARARGRPPPRRDGSSSCSPGRAAATGRAWAGDWPAGSGSSARPSRPAAPRSRRCSRSRWRWRRCGGRGVSSRRRRSGWRRAGWRRRTCRAR